jgi:hypothetical protein
MRCTGSVETDGGLKARQEFHVSDTVRGYAYATTRVVRDTPYVITARRALLIAALDDLEPLALMCGVPLMYDVALCHSMIPSCHTIQL